MYLRYIVAGFANGIVSLWNLQAKSLSLLNGDVLHPIWSFYAHNSIITCKYPEVVTIFVL